MEAARGDEELKVTTTDFMSLLPFWGTFNSILQFKNIHRYLKNSEQSSLATVYYRRAVEMDTDVGQAFNQLAINETPVKSVRSDFCPYYSGGIYP